MIIYLAARYSRRLELCGYRDQLTARGHVVPARWLDGSHQIGNDGMPLTEEGERRFEEGHPDADHLRARFACHDLEDVLGCDMLIAFTEPPRSGTSRGGRHVELGIALGRDIPVTIIGPRENVFCWLPQVSCYPDFRSLLPDLGCSGSCACHEMSSICGTCCTTEEPS